MVRKSLDKTLLDAVLNQDFSAIQNCLERGFDINRVVPGLESTLFSFAVKMGNFSIMQSLLEFGAAPTLTDLNTGLCVSAACGRDEFINIFLNLNANINIINSGLTPLMLATHVANPPNDLKCVKILVSKGASLSIEGAFRNTALTVAICDEKKRVAKLLIDNEVSRENENSAYLLVASSKGDIRKMHSLLNKDIDVNFQDIDGNSILHWTVYRKQKRALSILLDYNINLNVECASGTPAIFAAVREGDIEIVEMLLSAGVDIDFITKNNENITDAAYASGIYSEAGLQILRLLKKYGAPPLSNAFCKKDQAKWKIL